MLVFRPSFLVWLNEIKSVLICNNNMNIFSKIFKSILKHKLLTGIVLVLVATGGYFGYNALTNKDKATRYLTAAVEKGTLIVSVSGSGQVSALDQVDIKPKVSGEVVYAGVTNGQEVKAGTLIAQLDTRDAQKAVRDAEISLAEAELALKNLNGKAEQSLAQAYEDAFNALTSTFKDDLLPIMSGLKEIFGTLLKSSYGSKETDIDYYLRIVRLYSNDPGQLSYWAEPAEQRYLTAKTQFNAVYTGYQALNQSSSYDRIEIILNQSYGTTRTLLDLVRQTLNLIQRYQTLLEAENITSPIPATNPETQVSQLSEFTSSLINRVDALSLIKSSLIDKKEAVDRKDLDIEAQNLTVKQCEYALSDAKENLTQHYIRVPFDGIITKINVKKGDSVSASTVLINLVTKQKIAEITLNEIDAAKVKVGQKATLTFDALPEISISGRVFEIDAMGTANQGVVSYGVKIAFDTRAATKGEEEDLSSLTTEEEKIKPGMSITADIITDAKQDVLVLPNGTIKSQGNSYYVELVEASEEMRQQLLTNTSGTILPNPPKQQQVETGLSNDLSTEIISGLKEGDIVVTSTISPNKVQTTQTRTTQTQEFRIPGMGR